MCTSGQELAPEISLFQLFGLAMNGRLHHPPRAPACGPGLKSLVHADQDPSGSLRPRSSVLAISSVHVRASSLQRH